MEIRRYIESDHDAVWNLHRLALEEAGAFGGHGPWDEDLHHVESFYLNNRGEFLIGTIEGRLIAMGAFRRIDDRTAEVKRMRVHPNFQRQGSGQAIYDRLEEQARQLGYKKLCLDTGVSMTAARKFYLKNGFRQTGRTKLASFDLLLFEKEI
jgi:ribosomal protein S18 acetylase RimI-like enzyme